MGVWQRSLEDLDVSGFWNGKTVLVTGHTGFKGSWLSFWLNALGARVCGLALVPDTEPALFEQLRLADDIDHALGDIRDPASVDARIAEVNPDIVFHLAAQPLVLRSYSEPVETWQTNVAGTLNVLDALRRLNRPVTILVVTTDKVYENRELHRPYHESDPLGGIDPYSASKAAVELLAASWRASFGADGGQRIATVRAGNVIGGGDWAENRIVPDIVRALGRGHPIDVRHPGAVRPWQHVLEPLSGYMRLAERLHSDAGLAAAYNFGPAPDDFRSVRDLVEQALASWPGTWRDVSRLHVPHEAGLLTVASDLARNKLGWEPRWSFETAVAATLGWYRAVAAGVPAVEITRAQIADHEAV